MTRATLKGDRTSRQDFRKKKFFSNFFKNDPFRVILCEKSIARIPEAWKCFLDPDSGKWDVVYWSENQTFSDFYEKTVDS